jgi:hypothetical protein
VTVKRREITWPGLLSGALSGVLAAAVALGVAQLVAGITGALGSPIDAIGEVAINHTPIPVKEFAIAHFGSRDKDALVTGILVVLISAATVAGALAVRRLWQGLAVLSLFGAAGVAAAVSQPGAAGADVLPTLAGMTSAAVALILLTRSARAACHPTSRTVTAGLPTTADVPMTAGRPATAAVPVTPGASLTPGLSMSSRLPEERVTPIIPSGPKLPAGPSPASPELPAVMLPATMLPGGPERPPGSSRRRFFITAGGVAAVAAAGGGAGQLLLGRFSVASSRAAVRLPAPAVAAPAVPAGAQLRIGGLSPFFTSNSQFYRVDTDLVVPQVAPESWTLRTDGMVRSPVEITFDELLRMPLTEADITLVCVSNVVGGPYAGNARCSACPWPRCCARLASRPAPIRCCRRAPTE